ncbi:MAG: CO dehydrogenase/acetyl-CoA synthase delta subunit, TIM barrel [Clostridia bacterium 62_21]|nr:MAG: CO dehydrogenase/acetyl-CoA synthase delta subunit, TIM barrel [Clostridia bacterium 62_21]HAG07275.1 acetyl-CoA decarbonylase/synthase complex subunit gamma [Peptococcaceae bacterium]
MALTGLEIYKLLPRTNCGDCGQPTCLAFAMQLAAGKASLDACPHASEEAREVLGAAASPPIALITIGVGENTVQVGNETVLFRHEKRFEHQTAIGITVDDTLAPPALAARVETIKNLVFERVGQTCGVDLVAVRNLSGDASTFRAAVGVAAAASLPLVLMSENAASLAAALEIAGEKRPLVWAATPDNYRDVVPLAQRYAAPLVVRAPGLDALASLVAEVTAAGHKQLLLDTGAQDVGGLLADQTHVRRLAVQKRFRLFGYPTFCHIAGDDPIQNVLLAALGIAKYVAVLVIDTVDPADLLALVTWRLNIYTDPQRPVAVEPGLYTVGNPGPDAPVFVTTNFSLTYFCVAGDVEAARVPAYILAVDTDGTSVLTAWAAGKLTPEKIAAALESAGVAGLVRHRRLIIPGSIAVLSGKLADLCRWEVLVGPRESSGIPAYLKEHWRPS